jgi:hypothetical protein
LDLNWLILSSEHHKHQNERGTGIGSTSTATYDNTTGSSTTGAGQSHLGRDAGVSAAGVGATSALPGPAPNTAGPHKQDWLNKLDPRVNANPDQLQSTGHGPLKVTEGHDAAAVGAVGGAGAYEAGKHHHGTESGIGGTSSTTTAGPHSSNLANKADPTVDSDRSKDHHYGRDAGIAGGVGAAAYEADKHHKHDKDLTASEREVKKEHKHELKEEKREEKREHKDSKGGPLSFLRKPLTFQELLTIC